jgi:hypothetical protein
MPYLILRCARSPSIGGGGVLSEEYIHNITHGNRWVDHRTMLASSMQLCALLS